MQAAILLKIVTTIVLCLLITKRCCAKRGSFEKMTVPMHCDSTGCRPAVDIRAIIKEEDRRMAEEFNKAALRRAGKSRPTNIKKKTSQATKTNCGATKEKGTAEPTMTSDAVATQGNTKASSSKPEVTDTPLATTEYSTTGIVDGLASTAALKVGTTSAPITSTTPTTTKLSSDTTATATSIGTDRSSHTTVTTETTEANTVMTETKASSDTAATKASSDTKPKTSFSDTIATTEYSDTTVTKASLVATVATLSSDTAVATSSSDTAVTEKTQTNASSDTKPKTSFSDTIVTTEYSDSTVTRASTVTALTKPSSDTTEIKASSVTAVTKASADTAAREENTVTTATKASSDTTATKAPSETTATKPPPDTTATKASSDTTATKASSDTTKAYSDRMATKAPSDTTALEASSVTTATQASPNTTATKASSDTTATKASSDTKAPSDTTATKASSDTASTKAYSDITSTKASSASTTKKSSSSSPAATTIRRTEPALGYNDVTFSSASDPVPLSTMEYPAKGVESSPIGVTASGTTTTVSDIAKITAPTTSNTLASTKTMTSTSPSDLPAIVWECLDNDHCYQLFTDALDYQKARENCGEYRASLASTGIRDNSTKSQLIHRILDPSGLSTFWIGLDDNIEEGTWIWSDDHVNDSIDWNTNEPNGSWSENCGQIVKNTGWSINDVACSTELPYLCELELASKDAVEGSASGWEGSAYTTYQYWETTGGYTQHTSNITSSSGFTSGMGSAEYNNIEYLASNGYMYWIPDDEKVSYEEAKMSCEAVNASLAAVGMRNVTVKIEVLDALQPDTNHIWVGLDSIAETNGWVWSDGAVSTMNNTEWIKKPDETEFCARIYNSNTRWLLRSSPCHMKRKYICEAEVKFSHADVTGAATNNSTETTPCDNITTRHTTLDDTAALSSLQATQEARPSLRPPTANTTIQNGDVTVAMHSSQPTTTDATGMTSFQPMTTDAATTVSSQPTTTDATTMILSQPTSADATETTSSQPTTTDATETTSSQPTTTDATEMTSFQPMSTDATKMTSSQTTTTDATETTSSQLITTDATTMVSSQPMTTDATETTSSQPITTDATTMVSSQPTTTDATETTSSQPLTTDATTMVSLQPTTTEATTTVSSQPMTTDATETTSSQPATTDATTTVSSQPMTTDATETTSSQPATTDATTMVPSQPTTTDDIQTTSSQPATTDSTTMVSSQPMTTDATETTSSQHATTDATTMVPSQPTTTDGIQTTSSQPATPDATTMVSSQPVTTDATETTSSQPATTDATTMVSSQPMTTDATETTSSQPATTEATETTSSQPMTTDATETTSSQTATTDATTMVLSQPTTTNATKTTSSQPMTTDATTTVSSQPTTTDATTMVSSQPTTTDATKTTSSQPATTDATTTVPSQPTTTDAITTTSSPPMTTDTTTTIASQPTTTNATVTTSPKPTTTDATTTTASQPTTTDATQTTSSQPTTTYATTMTSSPPAATDATTMVSSQPMTTDATETTSSQTATTDTTTITASQPTTTDATTTTSPSPPLTPEATTMTLSEPTTTGATTNILTQEMTNSAIPPTQQTTTAAGWTKISSSHWYKVYENEVNYATANSSCSNTGARLVSQGLLSDISSSLVPNSKYWVGLVKNDEIWTWSDGTTIAADDHAWKRNEPSDNDQCGFVKKNGVEWELAGHNCASEKDYICERINNGQTLELSLMIADGWIRINSSHWYKVYDLPGNAEVDYATANSSCNGDGARLISQRLLDDISSNVTTDSKYWVGLVKNEIMWTWSDGATITTDDSAWMNGQPSSNDQCGFVRKKSHDEWELKGESCDDTKNYICERINNVQTLETSLTTAVTTTIGAESTQLLTTSTSPDLVTTGIVEQPPTTLSPADLVDKCGMGMKNGSIPESDITALSYRDTSPMYHPSNARLDNEAGSWVPKHNSGGEWIQVDLQESKAISGIVTQGSPPTATSSQWVETYKASCGDDQGSLITITDASGKEKVFEANTDAKVINKFPEVKRCRFIRIYPVSWKGGISMRMELLAAECFDLL